MRAGRALRSACTIAIAAALLQAACRSNDSAQTDAATARSVPGTTLRVLFVGNSLTYYNDLPARFAALHAARVPNLHVHTGLLAQDGAGLRDRLRDGSLARVLGAQSYDVVVLQEFGAWPACDRALPACEPDSASLEAAAAPARAHRARPLWFGTWMPRAQWQPALDQASRAIATRTRIAFADAGAAVHDVAARVPAVLLADGHPAPLGTWAIAAALSQAILPEAAFPGAAPRACGLDWQATSLRGDRLAVAPPAADRRCDAPASGQWRTIREAMKHAPPPSRPGM